jgi:protein-disulfide isomerase
MEVLTEIQLAASVEHVTDIKEIARYRVMGSPALVINGKVVAVGSVPSRDKLKTMLVQASAKQAEPAK